MLFSGGKDSVAMLHLARKAFFPARPPFPLLHVDTGWKFAELYALRDRLAAEAGMDLIVHRNPEAEARGINPFDHGAAVHTEMWKTEGLKQALDAGRFDVAFGGARRDEEMSRAKERIFSVRSASHGWDPKKQRPELWQLYNGRRAPGETLRVFPLSDWTERDIWAWVARERLARRLALFRRRAADGRARRHLAHRGRRPLSLRDGRHAPGPGPHRRLLAADRRGRERRRHDRGGARRNGPRRQLRALRPPDRQGSARLDGAQEAAGLFLMASSLLRFLTCGSVDDGKSTLIGRLLHDCRALPADKLDGLEDFSLLADGLEAEREQGITIDVAYLYFERGDRRFILADTPGHEQYTRNMATGASRADLAIVLVDASKGVLTQTRRHATIARLLGIRSFVLAVNKMDLVGFDRAVFDGIVADFAAFAKTVEIESFTAIPVSALEGDNITTSSPRTPWHDGPALLPLPRDGRARARARGRGPAAAGAAGDPRQRRAPLCRDDRRRQRPAGRRGDHRPRRHPRHRRPPRYDGRRSR